ncbi:MAG: GGDEF domain-containing protein [Clostridia bacterium]|nr:GGDEF domain-containing protein [Clostridia bacterium]
MNLLPVYIANVTGIAILTILLYASHARSLRDRLEDRIYSALVVGVMLGCAMETVTWVLDGRTFPGALALNYVANTYIFTFNALLPLFLLTYVDLCLYGDPKRIWRHYKPQIFVGAGAVLITVINFFTGIVYYFDEDNKYHRGNLNFLYYLVVVFFFITIYVVIWHFVQEHGARPFLNLNVLLIPMVVGTSLQFFFYGLSLVWLSSAVGLSGLYMMQQNEMSYIDSLSHTYNRQYLEHIFAAWIGKGRKFSGVMLDIDRFKRINDSLGHSEGDKALNDLAMILKKARREYEWIFRFAGDEFIILRLDGTPADMEEYMNRVNEEIRDFNEEPGRPYPLSISYGISSFDSGNVDTFMREMDDRMYDMKEEHHKAEAQ